MNSPIEYPIDWTPYTPLGDHIILRPLNYDERITSGGVILPQDAAVQKAEGIVLAVGPGKKFELSDHVLNAFVAGLHHSIEGIQLIMGALERACVATPPAYAVGDTVFFPPWLAQWERHSALNLEFCAIHSSQILGVYHNERN